MTPTTHRTKLLFVFKCLNSKHFWKQAHRFLENLFQFLSSRTNLLGIVAFSLSSYQSPTARMRTAAPFSPRTIATVNSLRSLATIWDALPSPAPLVDKQRVIISRLTFSANYFPPKHPRYTKPLNKLSHWLQSYHLMTTLRAFSCRLM